MPAQTAAIGPPDDAAAAEIRSLRAARAAVEACRRCPLYENATQAVFGAGPARAPFMLVGEQPGDREDLSGDPFVGPAGRVLDEALAASGIPRQAVYVTNAVKHFKFTRRGKKRLHQKPDAGEIAACRFWLDLERAFVRPQVIVAMGATAARSLLGRTVTISAMRGQPVPLEDGASLHVTVHPSYLLRIRGRDDAALERRRFEADLIAARQQLESLGTARGRGSSAA